MDDVPEGSSSSRPYYEALFPHQGQQQHQLATRMDRRNIILPESMSSSISTVKTSGEEVGSAHGTQSFLVSQSRFSGTNTTATPATSFPPSLSTGDTPSSLSSSDGQAAQDDPPNDSVPQQGPFEVDPRLFYSVNDNLHVPDNVMQDNLDLTYSAEEDGGLVSPLTEAPPRVALSLELNNIGQRIQGLLASNPSPGERDFIMQYIRRVVEPVDNVVRPARPFWRCPFEGFQTDHWHVFKRHSSQFHFIEAMWQCLFQADCAFQTHRGDKIRPHIIDRHLYVASDEDIAAVKTSYPPPPNCASCSQTVTSWREFWDCYSRHTRVDPVSSNVSPGEGGDDDDGDSRRRAGLTNANDHGDWRSVEAPSSSVHGHQMPTNTAGTGPRYSLPGAVVQRVTEASTTTRQRTQSAPNARPARSTTRAPRPLQRNPRPSPAPSPRRTNARQNRGSRTRGSRGRGRGGRAVPRPRGQASTSRQGMCFICAHPIFGCSDCQIDPPTTSGCHLCRAARIATPIQTDYPPINHVTEPGHPSLLSPQANQGQTNMGLTFPWTSFPNPEAWEHMQFQQFPAYEHHPGRSQFQSFALSQVLVGGMNEVEMETSILDIKARSLVKMTEKVGPALPLRLRPMTGPRELLTSANTSTPSSVAMQVTPRQEFGPPSLSQINLSAGCQCSCRTKSQSAYLGQGRAQIAPGRKIEMSFKMMPGDRVGGHPLRTRIQVLVKVLRLRHSAAQSATAKQKMKAHAAIKEALETSLEGSVAKTTPEFRDVDLDDAAVDSDAESIADSTFSACSRTSSYSDFGLLDASRDGSSILVCSRESSCTDLASLASRLEREEWEDEGYSSDGVPINDLGLLGREEKELEFKIDLDLEASLNKLSRWTGVPTDEICPEGSVWDPNKVFEHLMRYMLFVIFSLAHSRVFQRGPDGGNE